MSTCTPASAPGLDTDCPPPRRGTPRPPAVV